MSVTQFLAVGHIANFVFIRGNGKVWIRVEKHIFSDSFISILDGWAHILDVGWVVSSVTRGIGRIPLLTNDFRVFLHF